MKKIISALLLVSVLVLGGCSAGDKKEETKSQEITLNITVKDAVNNKELFKGDVTVNGKVKTLADFLEKAKDLEVEMEDGQFGKVILGVKGVRTDDFDKGPWWLYESSNNEACVANGSCNAADDLDIKDGDKFVFTYTHAFG
ncbi:MAG: hypothetical protein RR690_00745 [Longicatena sp.]